VTLVTAVSGDGGSLGIRLLADLQTIFGDTDHLFTSDVVNRLTALEMSPWADLRGKALDARSLANRLAKYEVRPASIRIGDRTGKGYKRDDLADVWARYVPPVEDNSLHSSKRFPSESVGHDDAPSSRKSVTSVTASQPNEAPPPDDDYFLCDDEDESDPWTLDRIEREFAR
jgi:hypothetical protein